MRKAKAEYRVTAAAESDIAEIATYTLRTWGSEQAYRYEMHLLAHFQRLAEGRQLSKPYRKGFPGVLVSVCSSHFVFHSPLENSSIVIIGVLHRSMNIVARLRKRVAPATPSA